MTAAVGVDIGGSGIKGAIVDVESGELLSDRVKHATPEGGRPDDIVQTVVSVLDELGAEDGLPVGLCFPAIVVRGRTMSAANVSDEWIGLEAEALFERAIDRGILFINDADAAGYAELRFGAARGRDGLVIMTTLGTGVGTALIHDGVLIPNSELGHFKVDGESIEKHISNAAREGLGLSWEQWAERLQDYYSQLERLFTPELFIVGGGVSKHHEHFLPLLDLVTPIVPAELRNNAGILGAAALAARDRSR